MKFIRRTQIFTALSNFFLPLLLILYPLSFFIRSDASFNQDLGMHLKLGEIIWKTHSIPKTNLFSYTNPAFPFVNHHWLFEVLSYLGSITVGLQTLLIVKIIVLMLVTLTIVLITRSKKSALFFPISFLFFHLLRERTDLRPEIFSFLFTVLTLTILELYEKKNSKLIFLLPFLSLLWVNSHIYFPVGILLQLVFLGDILFQYSVYKKHTPDLKKKRKMLSFIVAASIICSFINPHFITGALYPFTVFSNYGVTITENQTIFTLQRIHFVNPDFLFFYLAAFLVLGSIYASFWRTRFSFKSMSLSLLGLALAFQSIRGFPYLVLISLPYVLENCNYKSMNIWTKTMNAFFALLLFGEIIMYLNGSYYHLTYQQFNPSLRLLADEKSAVDFLLNHTLPQPIFNNFDTGSYLIYRTYPKYKVFIDERPEAYPASFFTDTYIPMQEDYAQFKRTEKKYHFSTIFFAITDQNPRAITFLHAVIKDPEWKTVFLDQSMIILVKNTGQNTAYLKSIDIAKLDLKNYQYKDIVAYTNLGTFLLNMHQIKEAYMFNQKALALSPDNPGANRVMAYIVYLENPKDYRIHDYLEKTSNWVFW